MNAWKTKPTRRLRSSVSAVSSMPASSVPPSRTEPEDGASSPAAQCRNVLLPDPEGPMTAVKLPRGMPADTSRRAATAPCPFPYTLLTASNRTTSVMASTLLTRYDAGQGGDHAYTMISS